MQTQQQLNTTAQSLVALFASNPNNSFSNATSVPSDLVSLLSVDPSCNVNQAFVKAASDHHSASRQPAKTLVTNAVSNIATLLQAKYSAEQIQGKQQDIIKALAGARPVDMKAEEYNSLIKEKLSQAITSASKISGKQGFDSYKEGTARTNDTRFKK